MQIIKASGEKEVFSKNKFCLSLKKAGAPSSMVNEVCKTIESNLKPGDTTSQIFRKASRYLMKRNAKIAARYNLKRGLAELGPAGFLFERFVEIILRSLGYKTLRNQIMQGKCVSHEIDVVAKNDKEHFLVEAKYRNKPWIKTHIDVVMYADARLQDLGSRYKMWVITNTKFTSKSIKYGKCKNIKLTGWKYPNGETLESIVEKYMLYPVTVLPSLNRSAREQFANDGIMLAQDLAPFSAENLIKKYRIDKRRASSLIKEAHMLIYGD